MFATLSLIVDKERPWCAAAFSSCLSRLVWRLLKPSLAQVTDSIYGNLSALAWLPSIARYTNEQGKVSVFRCE
ncbi:hypothetical protein OK016_12265 [Vibrio chagasii]|nr:hypothetical protein [Vibrio chagasii]